MKKIIKKSQLRQEVRKILKQQWQQGCIFSQQSQKDIRAGNNARKRKL